MARNFYPRPPRGGRRARQEPRPNRPAISIPALREEGDKSFARRRRNASNFYPRPPRGGRHVINNAFFKMLKFLSPPSARRATKPCQPQTHGQQISIPALREEGDPQRHGTGGHHPISIPALREEGDLQCLVTWSSHRYFYPRPPRGGRPEPCKVVIYALIFLSPPSARRATESHRCEQAPDLFLSPPSARRATTAGGLDLLGQGFLSPPSARRATTTKKRQSTSDTFLSPPSARRATAKTETKSLFSNKLYNILHEFRRALIYNGSKSYPNHAK